MTIDWSDSGQSAGMTELRLRDEGRRRRHWSDDYATERVLEWWRLRDNRRRRHHWNGMTSRATVHSNLSHLPHRKPVVVLSALSHLVPNLYPTFDRFP